MRPGRHGIRLRDLARAGEPPSGERDAQALGAVELAGAPAIAEIGDELQRAHEFAWVGQRHCSSSARLTTVKAHGRDTRAPTR